MSNAMQILIDGLKELKGDDAVETALINKLVQVAEAAKQEQGEPVAWFRKEDEEKIYYATQAWDDCLPLYTTPPQCKQPTDEQIEAGASALVDSCIAKGHWAYASDESKNVYRSHAKAVLTSSHGIAPQANTLSPAPCNKCGYNGAGYYQPDQHPCAAPQGSDNK